MSDITETTDLRPIEECAALMRIEFRYDCSGARPTVVAPSRGCR